MTGEEVLAIAAGVAAVLLLTLGVIGWTTASRQKKLVKASSAALTQLAVLNRHHQQVQVLGPPIRHRVTRHVDSKAKFDRVDGKQLLLAAVQESETALRLEVDRRLKAQRDFEEYQRSCAALRPLLGKSGTPELDATTFEQVENKMFARMQLRPPKLVAQVRVSLAYRSPAGRNSYLKSSQADFAGLMALLEELERTRREQSTTEFLRRQERNKVTPSLRYEVMRRDGNRCRHCGASAADGMVLHVDHVIPVSKGGRSNFDNLQTLCQTCNLGKSNRL